MPTHRVAGVHGTTSIRPPLARSCPELHRHFREHSWERSMREKTRQKARRDHSWLKMRRCILTCRPCKKSKRFLDPEQSNEALLKCERNCVSLTCSVPSTRMCAGFSVVTDRVAWCCFRIYVAFDATKQLARSLRYVFRTSWSRQEFQTAMEEGSLPFECWCSPSKRQISGRRKQEENDLEC